MSDNPSKKPSPKNLRELSDATSTFDCIVIGGGIVGAGIYRDLALNGVKTLIIDKNDFASKTSQWSSKMLHGGVRYLETFEFNLVKEALHEKNLWLKIAPHLCYENRFFLPVYEDGKNPLWKIRLGLFLYDLLSGFQNTSHESLNKENTLKEVIGLKPEGLKGSGIYYDAIVDDAKLTLETIYDGSIEDVGHALGHCEFIGFQESQNEDQRVDQGNEDYKYCKLKDNLTGVVKTIKARNIVFALGPYTDTVLKGLSLPTPWTPKMLPSKGIHLWVKENTLPVNYPLLLPLKDGRVMFVIPQKNRILIGTTETTPNSIDDTTATSEEIDYVKSAILDFFPNHPINDPDILGTYAGIRPLVKEEGADLGKTSREHKSYLVKPNVFAIAGGKLTTFRNMGQSISETICKGLHRSYDPDLTKNPLRQKSVVPSFQRIKLNQEMIDKIISNEFVRTKEDLLERRLGCINLDGYPYSEEIKNLNFEFD